MRSLITLLFLCVLTACASPTAPPSTVTSSPPSQTPVSTNPPNTPPPTPISPSIDFSIAIQKYESLSDGYILYGSYQWEGISEIKFLLLDDVTIRDASGNLVSFEHANPAGVITVGDHSLPFAFKITGGNYALPLLISVRSINAILSDTASFQFDTGINPQVGEEWTPALDVLLDPYHIFIHKIKVISGRTPTELGFLFTIWTGPNTNIVSLAITDLNATNAVYGGGGGGGDAIPGEIEYGWSLDGYSPAGLKTFQISDLNLKIYGEWQTTWQP